MGYQGGRYSGIAFTSERLLTNGEIPRVPALPGRLSVRNRPFSEPSATIVWEMLYDLEIVERTILWNALPLHPYNIGDPWSNRTPTAGELTYGAEALRRLVAEFPAAQVIAVGKMAEYQLSAFGINPLAAVRHPANGGATAFREKLKKM